MVSTCIYICMHIFHSSLSNDTVFSCFLLHTQFRHILEISLWTETLAILASYWPVGVLLNPPTASSPPTPSVASSLLIRCILNWTHRNLSVSSLLAVLIQAVWLVSLRSQTIVVWLQPIPVWERGRPLLSLQRGQRKIVRTVYSILCSCWVGTTHCVNTYTWVYAMHHKL